MRKSSFLIAALVIAALFIPVKTYADQGTEVTVPYIFQDTTFTAAGSPYIIRQSTELDQGSTLTIESGVTIEFASGASLIVYGKLDAEGAADSHVTFMPLPSATSSPSYDPGNDDWDLEFDASQNQPISTLSYTDITGSAGGMQFNNTNVLIRHSTLSHGSTGLEIFLGSVTVSDMTVSDIARNDGIDVFAGSLHADGLTIGGVQTAIELFNGAKLDGDKVVVDGSADPVQLDGIDAYGGSDIELTDSSIGNLTTGAAIGLYGSSAEVSASHFSGGQTIAVQVYGNQYIGHSSLSLRGSTIENFAQAGVALFDADGTYLLEKNTLTGNGDGLDYYAGALMLRQNSIYGNTQVGVQDENGSSDSDSDGSSSPSPLDLSDNWWGDASGPYEPDQNPSGQGNAAATFASGGATAGILQISPWLSDTSQTVPYSSVAFLPGVEGSRLYVQGEFSENQLWEPNRNADVEKLYLDDTGESVNQDVYTRDLIDRVNLVPLGFDSVVSPDIYEHFIQFMNGLIATGTIAAWQALPYDWRLSLSDLVAKGISLGGSADAPDLSYADSPPAGSEPYLISQIRQLAASSDTGKVTLIAHSNGGLVAKQLIANLEEMKTQDGDDLIDRIDRLILVAVPQLGTPDTLVSVLHGDGLDYLGGLILNQTVGREFASKMPTAYSLLPDERYFAAQLSSGSQLSPPLIAFEDSVKNIPTFGRDFSVDTIVGTSTSGITDFSGLQDFLLGINDGRAQPANSDIQSPDVLSSGLLSAVNASHASLDVMTFPAALAVTQIIGWGLDTIAGLDYSAAPTCTNVLLQKLHLCTPSYQLEHSPVFTSNGDGTVVAASAAALNVPSYFVDLHSYNAAQSVFSLDDNRGHADIMEVQPVQQIIYNVLTDAGNGPGAPAAAPDFSYEILPPVENAGNTLEIEADDGLRLDAYDSLGEHTGKIAAAVTATSTDSAADEDAVNFSEENIPNSSYREIGNKTYLVVDDSANPGTSTSATSSPAVASSTSETAIKVKGTKIGKSSVTITKKIADETTAIETFTDVPVTPATEGEIEEGIGGQVTDSTDQLVLDSNGDGTPDFSVPPSDSFDPILYLQAMKRTVSSLCIDVTDRQQMIARLNEAIAALQAGSISGGADIVEQNMVDDGTDDGVNAVNSSSTDDSGSAGATSPAQAQFIMQGLDDLLTALGV